MADVSRSKTMPDHGRRGFWLRHLHRWHWISSAICLIGLLLFTVTGITLNHAADIEAAPVVIPKSAVLPPPLLATLARPAEGKRPLPAPTRDWLEARLGIDVPADAAEWSIDEIYLAMPRPGGDAWLSVDRATGDVAYERTDRGWISYLNDLHKGRNTGGAWRWFIDVFAIAALIFSITGLFLLQLHSAQRPATWPVVGLGLLIPLVLALLFIH